MRAVLDKVLNPLIHHVCSIVSKLVFVQSSPHGGSGVVFGLWPTRCFLAATEDEEWRDGPSIGPNALNNRYNRPIAIACREQ